MGFGIVYDDFVGESEILEEYFKHPPLFYFRNHAGNTEDSHFEF
jgi:hypothetical protein